MKIFTIILGLVSLNFTLMAESDIPKEKIIKVVNAYAETIGCLKQLEEYNIVKYVVDKRDGENQYVVLFGIDPECSGGSAMYHTALAVLKQDYKGRIFLKPSKSFPVAKVELPQYTGKIFVRDNALLYRARDYNWEIASKDPDIEGDALCCPSLMVEGELSFQDGKWQAKPFPITYE